MTYPQQRRGPRRGQIGSDRQARALSGDDWIGISDTASYLSVPVRTMYRLAQLGKVPAVKVGRAWRFKRSALDAHLSRGLTTTYGDRSEPIRSDAMLRPPADPRRRGLVRVASAIADVGPGNNGPSSETGRWSEQLERIQALSHQLSRSRAVRSVAEAVASEIDSVIAWHGLRFYVLAPNGITLNAITLRSTVAHYANETPELVEIELGRGLAGNIAESGTAEIVSDVRRDPRMAKIPGTADVDESMIVVPLLYEDAVLGVLELSRLGLNAFDATDLRLAQIVGAQAAVALYNARQLEEIERRGQALERQLASQRQLLAITERLLGTGERGARVFDAIADTLAEVVPHDTLTIYLVNRVAGCLVPMLARDEYAEQILASRPGLGAGITGDVIGRGQAEMINDATHDPRVVHVPGTPSDEYESLIVAPVHSPEGVIGALNLYRAGHDFDADDLELVKLFTNLVAIALENATVQDRLVEAALTDSGTGLPNRRLFGDRVEHAIARGERSGGRIAVLFLDLDRFKLVNDSLGHAAGDQVLSAVAERLRGCTRVGDTVARLGGDEFGILIEDVSDPTEATVAASRVIDALSNPLRVGGRAVSVAASIGIALDRTDGQQTSEELLRDADTAMYQAKADGRGGFVVFEPSMHTRQLARLELDGELREAADRGQFVLHYQPIVKLSTGRVVKAEALVRWNHPTRGLVGPKEFIGHMEESGQIVELGAWVVREACRQAHRWQMELGTAPEFGVSVNTSAIELIQERFVPGIKAALAESGLAAGCLTLEITESMMLPDETAVIAALRELREAGVHVVIDDFGTGYSSLSYLEQLPVDGLKIDRSFTLGLGTEREKTAIVRATIAFAGALGLAITAEGIETEVQLRNLVALHCDLGQGFFFARPLETEAMNSLLASGRRYTVPPAPSTRGLRLAS